MKKEAFVSEMNDREAEVIALMKRAMDPNDPYVGAHEQDESDGAV